MVQLHIELPEVSSIAKVLPLLVVDVGRELRQGLVSIPRDRNAGDYRRFHGLLLARN